MQHQDSRGRLLKPCRGCGGPKPPGKGHGYCEACKAARSAPTPCLACGGPKSHGKHRICDRCRAEREAQHPICLRCGGPKPRTLGRRHCDACHAIVTAQKPCLICGGPKPSGRRMICDGCRLGRRGASSRRRARLRGVNVENVDHAVVYERDDGICGICGEPVDATDFHVDHIVPIALGGEHSYANAQVAHPACNKRKGVRLLAP